MAKIIRRAIPIGAIGEFITPPWSNLKEAPSRKLPLTARKTVFSHLKLTDLWITSLLFDLNNKFIKGASLLALYLYISHTNCRFKRVLGFVKEHA